MKILTASQRERFDTEGYLLVNEVFDPVEDLQPVLSEYSEVLDGIAEGLFKQGLISSTYGGLPLIQRLIAVCAESGRNFPQNFDFSLPQKNITNETPIHLGPAIFGILTHGRLLDLVEDIMGPEIYSNPVQHIRFKLPRHAIQQGSGNSLVDNVPWHQDNGVIMPEADESTILTAWMPLTPATTFNGCLQVVPRSHQKGLVPHCPNGGNTGIPTQLVAENEAVAVPMKPGSVLLMNQRTVHASLENKSSDDVRISMDLRFQPIGQPTGRPAFAPAGFNARSVAHPDTVLRDPAIWAARWLAVREQLAGSAPAFNRWRADAPMCA